MSTVLDEAILEDRPQVDLSVLAASLRAEPEQSAVLALDVGTSGVRAGLFDQRGDQIAGSQVSLASEISGLAGGTDVNADELFDATIRALDVVVARAEGLVSRIDYVAGSCFWHSLLGVDTEGHAVTPLFGWADTRAAQAVSELRSKFGEKAVHPRTGARFHPSYWPAKLLWLRRERSELCAKTRCWLSFSDYLFLRLFGDTRTSVSMASGTGLFNQIKCEWDREMLAGLGISSDQLPLIAGAGETLKQLSDDYALRWPL